MNNPSGPATAFDSLTVGGVPTMGMAGIPATSGNVYFVNSNTGNNGNSGAANDPLASLTGALGVTGLGAGDVIVLEPGHAESVVGAAGININVAGITIVTLGEGAKRATFTFGTSTAATITITAANVVFGLPENPIIGVCALDQIVSPFVVSAANVSLGIEWQDGASNMEAVQAILTTAAADNFFAYVKYIGFPAGSHCVSAVSLIGINNGKIVTDCYGKASISWVNMLTTACTNIEVYGYMYNSGTTDGSKDVTANVGSCTWFADVEDGAAGASYAGGSATSGTLYSESTTTIAAQQAVPSADSTANVLERDVIGAKDDTANATVGTTSSLMRYIKGLIGLEAVPGADVTTNTNARDVIGNKTDAVLTSVAATKSVLAYVKTALQNVGFLADSASYVLGTTFSLMSYLKALVDLHPRVAVSSTAVLADGTTIFTIAGGPIAILALVSECMVGGDATNASTVQYSNTVTGLAAQTFSNASGSVINAAAHATVSLIGTTLVANQAIGGAGGNGGAALVPNQA